MRITHSIMQLTEMTRRRFCHKNSLGSNISLVKMVYVNKKKTLKGTKYYIFRIVNFAFLI